MIKIVTYFILFYLQINFLTTSFLKHYTTLYYFICLPVLTDVIFLTAVF